MSLDYKRRGLVIRNTGSWYIVKDERGEEISCKVKGNFRLKGIRSTSPVVVGDRVSIQLNDQGTAFITAIDDRRNYIIRKSPNLSKQSHILAANIDLLLLVVTVARPVTSTTFIDRYLASAEAYSIPTVILINKWDTLDAEEREYAEALLTLYHTVGYQAYPLSARSGEGLDRVEALVAGHTVLISGHSGVGKSTLINRLVPDAALRTAEISETHESGMHTTTFSEMIPLIGGGYLIDTPGIKGFGTFGLVPEEVSSFFKDIFKESARCRFNDCTHRHEPGCAVIQAVEEHRISESRYHSYLSILDDESADRYR